MEDGCPISPYLFLIVVSCYSHLAEPFKWDWNCRKTCYYRSAGWWCHLVVERCLSGLFCSEPNQLFLWSIRPPPSFKQMWINVHQRICCCFYLYIVYCYISSGSPLSFSLTQLPHEALSPSALPAAATRAVARLAKWASYFWTPNTQNQIKEPLQSAVVPLGFFLENAINIIAKNWQTSNKSV